MTWQSLLQMSAACSIMLQAVMGPTYHHRGHAVQCAEQDNALSFDVHSMAGVVKYKEISVKANDKNMQTSYRT